MHHIYLQVKTASPVAIRADHAAGGAATAPYIPGTTLLGSFAAAHRMLRPKQEQEFARLFLEEHIFFPSLYPAVFNQSNMGIERANLPVRPLPKTAQSCKRFSGFQLLKDEIADNEVRHGIRDSLLDWAIFSLLDNEKQSIPELLSPLAQHEYCTHDSCHQPLDHINGYYRGAGRDPRQRMKAQSSRRLQHHVQHCQGDKIMTQELLVAGTISRKNFVELVKVYRTWLDIPMLVLMEALPHHIVKPEERLGLLQFALLHSDIDVARHTTGRIFHEYGELRWENIQDTVYIVYTGNEEYQPDLQQRQEKTLDGYKKVTRKYFLFGKRLDSNQLTRIGPAAQEGDFVELRIPRLLRYPQLPALAHAERVQLAVYELY